MPGIRRPGMASSVARTHAPNHPERVAGKATRVLIGLAVIAGLAAFLWSRRAKPVAPRPPVAVVPKVSAADQARLRRLEALIPRAPFAATNEFMRYDLAGGELVWGNLTLWPSFWGYEQRVELPEVSPRDLAWQRLADEMEGLLPPLAVVRWTSDWSEFLNRWLDPRLTSPRGMGFFNPNATYEGLKLLPVSREADFGFGLKYKWSF